MLGDLNAVNEHLFIGNARSVTDASLSENGITCVINCSNSEPTYATSAIKYFPLTVYDSEDENIDQYFDEITNLIFEEQQHGGKTVVYCVAGVSRSATLCIAYLVKYEEFTLRNAFKHLKSRRRIIRPNNGFFQQLIDFERKLNHRTTVTMVRIPDVGPPDYFVPDVFYEVSRGMIWLRSVKKAFKR